MAKERRMFMFYNSSKHDERGNKLGLRRRIAMLENE